eukprot:2827190-Ditylum_brightwellii.AAC.1
MLAAMKKGINRKQVYYLIIIPSGVYLGNQILGGSYHPQVIGPFWKDMAKPHPGLIDVIYTRHYIYWQIAEQGGEQ